MIDIKKLAKLTGIILQPDEEKTLSYQLESVASLLDKVKEYNINQPNTTRHSILGLKSKPSKSGLSDGTPEGILNNINHTITGHAIEVKAFVE